MSLVPAIQIDDLHKVYDTGETGVHALKGVDLRIETGELVAIMGPSGSGKTTLLEILGCLSRPTRGTYALAGRTVADLSGDELARVRGEEIGFVFQSFNLLPRLSAVENVEMPLGYRRVPRRTRRKRALEALERVGLAHRHDHRPGGMSGGERQRVAVARALVGNPKLVLADEPTGNLDTKTGSEILSLLEGLHDEGATVVIVTHNPTVGAAARRRLLLQDGRIEQDEQDTPGTSRGVGA